jgi:hypothetical protein
MALGSLVYDRRLRGDSYDTQRPSVLECEGRSAARLHYRSVHCDKLNFRSSTPTLARLQSCNTSLQEVYRKSKTDFLHRHILDYQNLFRELSKLSSGDAFLFLDDLYHIRRSDQPHVVDYYHRIAKGSNLWLKMGTIRHRTNWYVHGDPPIGVKLADDADAIDLDLTLEKYSLTQEFLTKVLKSFVSECKGQLVPDGEKRFRYRGRPYPRIG